MALHTQLLRAGKSSPLVWNRFFAYGALTAVAFPANIGHLSGLTSTAASSQKNINCCYSTFWKPLLYAADDRHNSFGSKLQNDFCVQKKRFCTETGGTDLSWIDVSYDELMKMIKSKDIQLFDVRQPQELVETGILPGSTNIPLSEVSDALKLSPTKFKEKYGVEMPHIDDGNIVFSCLGGIRSRRALNTAHKAGFHRARHYPGGWEEYSEMVKK